MDFADSHAHLDFFSDGTGAVVRRAEEAGVKAIITAGIGKDTNRKALHLSEQFAIVKASLGIYPINALRLSDSCVDSELGFIEKNSIRIVAIGEIGLDYEQAGDRKRQQEIFEMQIELAKKLGKPVVVHSRKAEEQVVGTLIKSGCKAVLHAFHGSLELAEKAANTGIRLSIPANLERAEHFQRIVKKVPISSLLTETDAPFMAPEKGGKSEPVMVERTVRQIAALKGLSTEETSNLLFSNYLALFGK